MPSLEPSLAGQMFAARRGEGGAREGGKRTSGHYIDRFPWHGGIQKRDDLSSSR